MYPRIMKQLSHSRMEQEQLTECNERSFSKRFFRGTPLSCSCSVSVWHRVAASVFASLTERPVSTRVTTGRRADTFAGVTVVRPGHMVTRDMSNMPRPTTSWGWRERSDDARPGRSADRAGAPKAKGREIAQQRARAQLAPPMP